MDKLSNMHLNISLLNEETFLLIIKNAFMKRKKGVINNYSFFYLAPLADVGPFNILELSGLLVLVILVAVVSTVLVS